MQIFKDRGQLEYQGKNLSEQSTEGTNKLNQNIKQSLETEPGPHWWETSALTSTLPLLSQ